MARWEPGTRERLQAAALELFATRGYETTTAAEIAQAVGLTERTFFRHFSDKPEVLFDGQQMLVEIFVAAIADAPPGTPPLGMVGAALRTTGEFFTDERRPWSRRRQAVIDANPALRERELRKLATLTGAARDALRDRGIPEPAATLAAESGGTVFGLAFGQWIRPDEERPLGAITEELLGHLVALTTPAAPLRTAASPAHPTTGTSDAQRSD